MSDKYILKGKTPVLEQDLLKWAEWFEGADRIVAQNKKDGVVASTVFLGIDHNFGDGEPLLFETMIFGGKHDGYQRRYSTWKEAELGHKQAVLLLYNKDRQP